MLLSRGYPGNDNSRLSSKTECFATHEEEKKKTIRLTSIACHDVLHLVGNAETFPHESNQVVVDIRIIHLWQHFFSRYKTICTQQLHAGTRWMTLCEGRKRANDGD
jgi:hypothetical protein